MSLEAVERLVGSAPAADWLPLLKRAVADGAHGTGPAHEREAALRRVLDRGIERAPADWELLCLRGVLRAGSSDFEGARQDFEKAVALAPDSPKPFSDRAYLRARQGDWAAALEDFDRAAALGGQDAGRSLERGLALLALGRSAEARAVLSKAAEGSRDPEAHYQLARALIVDGKPARALPALRAALDLSGPDQSRRRHYEMLEAAAASLAHALPRKPSVPGEAYMKEAKKKAAQDGRGCLWLLGIGIDRPYEVTLNTLLALRRCDAAYTQADAREVRELLEAVYPGLRTISHGGGSKKDPQAEVWETLRAELSRGAQVGYVTYGHPMLYGEGNMLAKRCREEGFRYRVMTAPSSIDGMLTMLQDDLDLCERGFWVGNARSLTIGEAALDPTRAGLIMGINRLIETGLFGQFCDGLEAAYEPDHPVFGLKCADGGREEARVLLTVAQVRAAERELDPHLSLFIPERRGAPRAPARPAKSKAKR